VGIRRNDCRRSHLPSQKGEKECHSLQPILLVANMNVSSTKICIDTSILLTSNMGQREYLILCMCWRKHHTTRRGLAMYESVGIIILFYSKDMKKFN
jgi:hypothetical protein